MKKLLLLLLLGLLPVACSSPGSKNAFTASNTNGNTIPHSVTENDYTFAQTSNLAFELTPSGNEASEIVGKTLSESNLWQNKKFEGRLRKLMGPDFATMKKYWNVETPIKKFGDFLMMTGCEQHNCADNQYVIFIDLGDGVINVVHIAKDSTRQWNAPREIRYLPPPFSEELAAMKANE